MTRELLNHYKRLLSNWKGRKYPCSNQIVVCGLIMSREQALAYMGEEEKIRERKYEIIWERNGERWIWKPWNRGCRGYRFYKIIVSEDFDEEIFRYVIYPCCALYCCNMEII